MTLSTAALVALYPVILVLGILIWMRYLPALRALPGGGVRSLVCAMLVLVITIVIEQAYYGSLRLAGPPVYAYWTWMTPLVGSLKLGYVAGFAYALYAFWLIAPARVAWWSYFAVAFVFWATVTVGLMF